MRNLDWSWVLLSFLVMPNAFSQVQVNSDAVAELEIGKPLPKLEQKRIVFQRQQRDENGDAFVLARIKVARSVVDVEIYDDLVWRIEIARPGLFTSDKAQVGTPVKTLMRRNLSIAPLLGSGPSLFLVPESPCGISYLTDLEFKRREYENLTREKVLKLARHAKVSKILVTGCGT